jgi:E3 ubiquitin-protein ligase MUL1
MLVLGEPRSGPFLFSRQPLPELVASLQSSSLACQQWAAAFAAVGASMLVTAGVQYALMWQRQRRLRARVEKALRDRAAAEGAAANAGAPGTAGSTAAREAGGMGADDGGVSSGLCVVCLERSCDTVFPSCGHMCACSRCSGGLSRCPICRSRGGPIRVYTT